MKVLSAYYVEPVTTERARTGPEALCDVLNLPETIASLSIIVSLLIIASPRIVSSSRCDAMTAATR